MVGAHLHLVDASPDASPTAPRRAREAAFSILEVVVVVGIATLLMGMAWMLMGSSRSTSGRAAAVATARSIGDTVEDFRKDHAGRTPVLGDAKDWPEPIASGPRNDYTGKRYMSQYVTEFDDGVELSTNASSAERWTLQYVRSGTGRGWEIVVHDGTGTIKPCRIAGGEVSASGVQPC